MELTIISLVCITFIAGVVGGVVIADSFDTFEDRREIRRLKRKLRHERKMRNIYVDNFGR
jgi:uncharacterized membrane protein YciS (DUF1049 family)